MSKKSPIAFAAAVIAVLAFGFEALPALAQQPSQGQPPPKAPDKATAPQSDQKAKVVGEFGDWQALTYKDAKGDTCYVASFPKNSVGHQGKLGETNILVSHWPSQKSFGVVSIAADYEYKKDSEVDLAVGRDTFKLYTQGKRAWSKDDEKVVEALKVGKEAVVEAVTAKGTKTKDNYSLNGFAKAYQVASKACGVKS